MEAHIRSGRLHSVRSPRGQDVNMTIGLGALVVLSILVSIMAMVSKDGKRLQKHRKAVMWH